VSVHISSKRRTLKGGQLFNLLWVPGSSECKTCVSFLANDLTPYSTYSVRTHGTWCFGYHDGDKGYFPASAVALDLPAKDEVPSNPKSTLWATAKWDHKPKEGQHDWLVFKKGEKITNIDFASQDAWCWSGHHKGKRGLFPACFVEGLKQDVTLGQSGPSPGRHGSGDVSPKSHSKIGSFIIRRTTLMKWGFRLVRIS